MAKDASASDSEPLYELSQSAGPADLLVVDGNPLEDIKVLTNPEQRLLAIMKQGHFYKDLLS